jgi:K+/H+ antiporter YhaU regulatory subunit KhtT
LVVLTISFLITRLGTAALTLTGVSHDLARLQAVSAFTGVGFTTSESEQIVNHPARRRILIILMILGNAGIVTAVSTLLLSFLGVTEQSQWLSRGALLVIGLAVLWCIATSNWVERHLSRLLEAMLKRFTDLQTFDFAELLDLSGRYTVRTLHVQTNDWVEGKRLSETELFQEGVTVLGIHRASGRFLGVPRGETPVETGDELVLYGRKDRLSELDDRRRGRPGDEAHARAVSDQQRERRSQQENA